MLEQRLREKEALADKLEQEKGESKPTSNSDVLLLTIVITMFSSHYRKAGELREEITNDLQGEVHVGAAFIQRREEVGWHDMS